MPKAQTFEQRQKMWELAKKRTSCTINNQNVHNEYEIKIAAILAAKDAQVSTGKYLRQALIEKLIRDGYLQNPIE